MQIALIHHSCQLQPDIERIQTALVACRRGLTIALFVARMDSVSAVHFGPLAEQHQSQKSALMTPFSYDLWR